MKKIILSLSLALLTSLLTMNLALACLPTPRLTEYCGADLSCSAGNTCYYFEKLDHNICWSEKDDPCQSCGYPAMCLVTSSAPKQISCNTCEDYHYSNCPSLCEKKCLPSGCNPNSNGDIACPADCEGAGSCYDPISAGNLIKTKNSSTIYYVYNYLGKLKRFPIPNAKTFKSWYNDFSKIKMVTDGKLQSYPLSGLNITYRPGTLVKITTDPKVYLVSRGGYLHWITTEELARNIAGANWASLVQDLPDEFFGNYMALSEIENMEDYNNLKILSDIDLKDDITTKIPVPTC
jgi:hypothetical protein